MANVTTASLGALESEHGLERVLIRRAVRAGVLIVGGGLMIATGYAAHKFTPQLYDEVPVLRIGPLVAAAVAWLLGLFTLAAVLSKRGTRLVLHEHGLSNTQRHKTNLFLWDEIESVRVSILSSGKNESHRYVIRGPKGAEMVRM